MSKKEENKLENKKKKVTLNHQVRLSSRQRIDAQYKMIEIYCNANGFEVPQKGVFVSDVIDASPVITMDPASYLKKY